MKRRWIVTDMRCRGRGGVGGGGVMMFLVASEVGNQLHKSLSFTSLSLLVFFNKQNHRLKCTLVCVCVCVFLFFY